MNKRDPWERIVAAQTPGIYESNYLKANSPDGQRGLWIKHNLLRRLDGTGLGEFWLIWFERGRRPGVVKHEVEWPSLTLSQDAIGIQAGPISLTPDHAKGRIGDIEWDLTLTPSLAPLLHFPSDWMYSAGFPKKKAVTPAPNLGFDGRLQIDGDEWPIENWTGLRGHNWGREHAHTYAYGNCNIWDDHAPRTVDGFSARIRLPGGLLSPWLSTMVGVAPDHALNGLQHWFCSGQVGQTNWTMKAGGCTLTMSCDKRTYVGLRYIHPDGSESYCYNTKFADVQWHTPQGEFTSQLGELEVLVPTPMDDVPLHPTPDWRPQDGPYRG